LKARTKRGAVECATDCIVSSAGVCGNCRKPKEASEDLRVAGSGAGKVGIAANGQRIFDKPVEDLAANPEPVGARANQPVSVVLSPNAII
jgi:hypothetical protein